MHLVVGGSNISRRVRPCLTGKGVQLFPRVASRQKAGDTRCTRFPFALGAVVWIVTVPHAASPSAEDCSPRPLRQVVWISDPRCFAGLLALPRAVGPLELLDGYAKVW